MEVKKTAKESNEDKIMDFVELVASIVDYYSFNIEESGESWKSGTEYENTKVPNEVDELVKKAFKSQLRKFI